MAEPQIIDGRYERLGELGRGGMAVVLHARHRTLGTEVAIKLLSVGSEVLAERLLVEGRAHALLAHRHVVQVVDVVEHQGTPGLVMERVRGPTLAEVLRSGPLPPDEADLVARAILRGVEAAHAQGLVHRDLKPGNVLLAIDGDEVVPKVADFGLVKQLDGEVTDPLTQTGAALGTPAYMAPEQVRDPRDVDARADVFSLGALLYELVSGHRCFRADDGFELLAKVTRAERVPLVERLEAEDREAPHRMLEAVAGALAVDRAQRWPTVADLRAAWEDGVVPPDAMASLRARVGAVWAEREASRVDTASAETLASWASDVDGAVSAAAPSPDVVGRGTELALLARRERGLVTLRGPGGVGKTTLARAWAAQTGAAFAGCEAASQPADLLDVVVALFDLGDPCRRADEVVALIASVVARPGFRGLVLDNLEQLLPAVGPWVARWAEAAAAPVVVTSRVRLELPGEQVVDVAPLGTDDGLALLRRKLPAHLSVSDATLHGVVEQLEGVPLALELAAARLVTWDPAELVRRLATDLSVLRQRGAVGRHGSAWSAVEWSWSLLAPAARATLAQCSVFVGQFTVDAAEAVVVLPPGEAVWEQLELLEAASLLSVQGEGTAADPRRLAMLHLTRQFAAEQLTAMPDGAEAALRHLRWAVERGEALRDRAAVRFDPVVQGAHERLGPELVKAARRGHAQAPVLAARAVLCRPELPANRGNLAAHAAQLDQVLAWTQADDAPADARARALWLRGLVARLQGEGLAARGWLEEALRTAELHGLVRLEGVVHGQLGNVAGSRGEIPLAEHHYRRAVEVLEGAEHRRTRAVFLGNLGVIAVHRGELAQAVSLYTEALGVLCDGGSPTNVALFRVNLSNVLFRLGRTEEADREVEQALAWFEEAGQGRRRAKVLANRAYQALDLGELATAHERIVEAIHGLSGREVPLSLANALLTLGDVHLLREQPTEAERAYRHGLALAVNAGGRRLEGIGAWLLGRLAHQQGQLPAAATWLARATSALADVGDREHLAYAVLYAGVVAIESGRGEQVTELLRTHHGVLAVGEQRAVHGPLDVLRAYRGDDVPLRAVWEASETDHQLRLALRLLQR